ncbi:MAG: SdrD B-like domain-containing protein [Thiotrichales bacterium]
MTAGLVFLAAVLLVAGAQAATPVLELTTRSLPATPSSYVGPDGLTYNYGTGRDIYVTSVGVEVDGRREIVVPAATFDKVNVKRVESNLTGTNASGILGERLYFQYEGVREGNVVNIRSSRFFSMEDTLGTVQVNSGNGDLFCNVGARPNNIERVDILTTRGMLAPTTAQGIARSGFVIGERFGNNFYKVAAVLAIDVAGNPTAFGPLVFGDITNYGPPLYLPEGSLRILRTPADSSDPGQLPTEQFAVVGQGWQAQFHSLAELGLQPGQRFYGYSMFHSDVEASMDLVGLSDVPLNTSDGAPEFDCGDHFGGGGTFYSPADLAFGSVSGFVWNDVNANGTRDTGEAGFGNVSLDLVLDANGNGVRDAGELVVADTVTAADGAYRFVNLSPGRYLVAVSDTSNVLVDQILVSGVNPRPIGILPGQDLTEQNFGYRTNVAIGAAKQLVQISQVDNTTSDVDLLFTLRNLSANQAAPNVQLIDDLVATFPGVASVVVLSPPVVSGGLTAANPGYNGVTDTRMLAGTQTLAPGASATITLRIRVDVGPVGEGIYYNQALFTASPTPGGPPISTDLSDNGIEPDPNGNGRADDPGEDDPTPIPLTTRPVIGIAKQATMLEAYGPGIFVSRITLVVDNLGGRELFDVQITDNLTDEFGTAVALANLAQPGQYAVSNVRFIQNSRSPLVLNPAYDGTAANAGLLNPAAGGSLAISESVVLSFDLSFIPLTPSGVLWNQAIASGDVVRDGVPDGDTTDLSDDGLVTDSDRDGNPNEPGENDPTPIEYREQAALGLAKNLDQLDLINVNVVDGRYKLEYEARFTLVVENLGNVEIRDLQVVEDLRQTFPAPIAITAVRDVAATGSLVLNPGFNGQSDTRLLDAERSVLPAKSRQTITLTVRFDLNGVEGELVNQVVGTGVSILGTPVRDLSDDGLIPDSDGDGRADGPGEDDPTPIRPSEESIISLFKSVGKNEVTLGDIVPYTLQVRNNLNIVLPQVRVVDTTPPGFGYVGESALLVRPGADGRFDTADDIVAPIVPAVNGRELVFSGFDLEPRELVELRYLLRVSTGVNTGDYVNTAIVQDLGATRISNQARAAVRLSQDPLLEQTTIIGKVFNDRDRDGYQDPADASRITISGGEFGKGGKVLGDIAGRTHETDPVEARQLRVPLARGAYRVTSAEGSVLDIDAEGRVTERHMGEKSRGMTGQDLRLEFIGDGAESHLVISNHGITEEGIPGVRLATVDGLVIETDLYGRYHIAGVDTGRIERGANYIVKVDSATLPAGAEFTTENPRVLRLGKSLMTRFNFGVKLPEQGMPEQIIEETQQVVERKRVPLLGVPNVNFDSGKDDLTRRAVGILDSTVTQLRDKENIEFDITGHTDSQRVGKPETVRKFGNNVRLGEARADRVGDYLKEKLELPESAVTTRGYAEARPISSNKSPRGMAENRRAEIKGAYDEKTVRDVKVEKTVRLPHGGVLWVTEDPAKVDPRLVAQALKPLLIGRDGNPESVPFQIYSNYASFIARWEIALYADDDRDLVRPLKVLTGDQLSNAAAVEWDGRFDNGETPRAGSQLSYLLRVYDAAGRWDETVTRSLQVIDKRIVRKDDKKIARMMQQATDAIYGQTQLAKQTIPVAGSRVRIHGADLDPEFTLTINDEPVRVGENGRFAIEQQLPVGSYLYDVTVLDKDGLRWDRKLGVDVTGEYFFLVGIANLTVGQNDVSGNIAPLNGDDHFDEDVFVDGRAAMYLKGKIKGKYLLTAQFDTTEDQLHKLGDHLRRKEPQSLFRKLDPDRYYPVYGDDSTTQRDVNTQGALYVRLEWDQSQAMWGNFNTLFTGNEFAHYNRSLYGAHLMHRATELTRFGDRKHEVYGFASEAETAMGHNAFLGTGGSLYYLRDREVIEGSEKVWVEVRDRSTGRVLETRTYRVGQDYDIDYFQGRIILNRPLAQVDALGSGGSIIKDRPLEGNDVVMLVDYEYLPNSFTGQELSAGVRGKTWVNDNVGIGATVVNEDRDVGADYELYGADVTLKAGKGTHLKLELAQSRATQTQGGWSSVNGGLSFGRIQDIANDRRKGTAHAIEAQVNLSELTDGEAQGRVQVWSKARGAEFSSARSDNGRVMRDTGVDARWAVNDTVALSTRMTQVESAATSGLLANGNSREERDLSVQARVTTSDQLDLIAEVRSAEQREIDAVTGVATPNARATLGAVGFDYQADDATTVYGAAQTTIDKNPAYRDNDAVTLGAKRQVNDSLAVLGEVTTGDRGDALTLGADYAVTQDMTVNLAAGFGDGAASRIGTSYTTAGGTELYGAYAIDTDRTDQEERSLTLGQRKRFGHATQLFSEQQFARRDQDAGITQVFGVEHALDRHYTVSGSLQHSRFDTAAGDIERDAASAGLGFRDRDLKASTRLEYRRDRSASGTSEAGDTTQWVTSNALNWAQNPHLRWLIKLNLARTTNDATGGTEASFVEGNLGAAYRPAFNDRLNLLAKYSYLSDLGSSGQRDLVPDERSHVLSVEALYDLTRRWEIGGKLAYRKGETRLQRDSGPWFDSGAHMALVRGRYHFVKRWDAMVEYRWLEAETKDDVNHGALTGVYFRVNDHFRVGAGYNFTDFDDNLTRLNYRTRGWFLDFVGSF